MTDYTEQEVKAAAEFVNWEAVAAEGTEFFGALVLRREAVLFDTLEVKTGSYYDGYESNAQENYVIFAVGNQVFKKSGWADSYGDHEWEGEVIEVVARSQSSTVYVPKN